MYSTTHRTGFKHYLPITMHTEKIWHSVRSWAHKLRENILTIWIAARDKRTPVIAKYLALITAGYALSPIDLVPDFIPVLGYLDDLILVPAGIALIVRLIPADLLREYQILAQSMESRPVGYATAFVIIVLWVTVTMLMIRVFV